MIVRFMADGKTSPLHEKSFVLYPNPTRGKIYIDGTIKIKSTTVCDIAGKILSIITTDPNEVNIQSLSAGIYILCITDTINHTERFKIVKK